MKINITIIGGRASGKTTMAQFLYSILIEHGFDIKVFDDGNHEMDLLEIDVSKFDKFTPLRSGVHITVKESFDLEVGFGKTNPYLNHGIFESTGTKTHDIPIKLVDNMIGTESFNNIKDKLFTKTNKEK